MCFMNLIKIARINAGKLIFFIYFVQIIYFVISRSIPFAFHGYQIAQFNWVVFLEFLLLTTIFALIGVFVVKCVYPFKRRYIKIKWLYFFIIVACIINLIFFFVVDSHARQSAGTYTPLSWLVSKFSRAFVLCVVLLIVREKESGTYINPFFIWMLLISALVTVDGLGTSLTVFCYFILLFQSKKFSITQWIIVSLCAILLLVFGFNSKFGGNNGASVSPYYVAQWTIGRFAIQSEQSYKFLYDDVPVINSDYVYFNLLDRELSHKLALAFGIDSPNINPGSVNEATYFMMYGEYTGSGSSPGAVLSSLYLSPFLFILPIILYSFICFQHFYGYKRKFKIWLLPVYLFVFRPFYVSFSGYLVILSPTMMAFTIFILFSLITSNKNAYQK